MELSDKTSFTNPELEPIDLGINSRANGLYYHVEGNPISEKGMMDKNRPRRGIVSVPADKGKRNEAYLERLAQLAQGASTGKYTDIKSRYMDHFKKPNKEERKWFSGMNWKSYQRLEVIHDFLNELDNNYPSLCTTGVIGTSVESRDLKLLKISNSGANNVSVWLDAGIHAREWIAPAVATYIANHLVRNFHELPSSVTNKDWYILPVMNPDGYEYSHTANRLWRKNKAWHGGQCAGVDLNRNFSFGWGGYGSSDVPSSPFYRGPEPFSEPESSAVRDFIIDSGIDFKVYITLHSYGQIILFPFAYREELCPDYIQLLEGATVMSKAIYKASGNTYKVGISRDVMYGAAGTSNDWSYGVARIPYCYLLELRSKKHKFNLPQTEIEDTGNEILCSVLALMDFLDKNAANKKTSKNSFKMQSRFNANSYLRIYKIIKTFLTCPLKFVKVAPPTPKSQVWELRFTNDGQRYFVRSLDTVGAINIWKEEKSSMDIFVDGSRASQVAGMLHEREVPFSVAIRDIEVMKEREQGGARCHSNEHGSSSRRRMSSGASRSMDWKNYYRLDAIYSFMDRLAADYPYLCNVIVIGKSYEGRDIKVLKISDGNPDNEGVWLDGAIHPREWISSAVVTYIADNIVRTFHKQPTCVAGKDWYILPVLNPDGYEYTHTSDRMWRKNRSRYGECVGVDLNRNFSYGWGEKGEEGSSEDPGSIFYRGPKPFSEPETDALKRVILDSDTEFKVFLSFHSYGEVVIFPWGYTSDPCPDYVELLEGGTAMSKAIYASSGHTYKVGSTKDLMYYAAGTSIDWSYAVANIPYSYMLELRGKKHRFLLPKEEIISTAAEAYCGVMTLMKFVDRRSKEPQHDPVD